MQAPSHQAQFARLASAFESHRKTANDTLKMVGFLVMLGIVKVLIGLLQADSSVTDPQVAADLKKRRTFRTFSYRGVELDKLLDLSNEDVRVCISLNHGWILI